MKSFSIITMVCICLISFAVAEDDDVVPNTTHLPPMKPRPQSAPVKPKPNSNTATPINSIVSGGGSLQPGCNVRPICNGTIDDPCEPGQYLADRCWNNVYYECTNGALNPFVCSKGLFVNPEAVQDPGNPQYALCDWPPIPFTSNQCGCNPRCAMPPVCPAPVIDPENPDCTGTVLIPHRCDCQFFWTCDAQRHAILSVCGPNQYFLPSSDFSGACTNAGGRLESTACPHGPCGQGNKTAACLHDEEDSKLSAHVAQKTRYPFKALLRGRNSQSSVRKNILRQ